MPATKAGIEREFLLTGRPVRWESTVGLRSHPEVGLECLPSLGEAALGIVVAQGGHDDDILTVFQFAGVATV